MPRNFLLYWKPGRVKWALDRGWVARNMGSDQLYRARRGDTVWGATVYSPGELVLVGRLRVGECTDYEGAKRILDTDDVIEKNYQVIAEAGTAERVREVDLMDLAGELRFVSKAGKDRLQVTDGRVKAQQLQTMRELTEDSAAMLEERWLSNQGATLKRRSLRAGHR